MKKRFFGALLASCACVAALASCAVGEEVAKLQVVDANGKVTETEIKASSDANEVATSFENVVNAQANEEQVKKLTGITTDLSATASVTMKDSVINSVLGNGTTTAEKATISATASLHEAMLFDENCPRLEASAKVDLKSTGSSAADVLLAKVPTGEVSVFNDGYKVYAAGTVAYAGETTTKKVYYDFTDTVEKAEQAGNSYVSELTKIDADALLELKTSLGSEILLEIGVDEEAVANYVETGYFEFTTDVHNKLVKFCEDNNVAISNVTKDSFTVGMNVEGEISENSKVSARVLITLTTNLLPLSVTATSNDIATAAINELLGAGEAITGMVSSNLVESSKLSVSLTIAYSATISAHATDGYEEVTEEDIEGLLGMFLD